MADLLADVRAALHRIRVKLYPGRLAGIVPELPAGRAWKIEVQTRYAGSKELKDLRVITSDFTLTVPVASDEAADVPAVSDTAEGGPASEAGTT